MSPRRSRSTRRSPGRADSETPPHGAIAKRGAGPRREAMNQTTTTWPRKDARVMNHHMDSTVWNDSRSATTTSSWHLRQVGHHLGPSRSSASWCSRATRAWPRRDLALARPARAAKEVKFEQLAPRPTAGSSRPTSRWTPSSSRRGPSTSTSAATDATCCSRLQPPQPGNALWYELLNDTPRRVGPPIDPPDPDIRAYFPPLAGRGRLSIWSSGKTSPPGGRRATCPTSSW